MSATCGNNGGSGSNSTTSNPCQGLTDPFGFTAASCQCAQISYGTDPKQKYDIYIPQTPVNQGTLRPIVIFIHGGGFGKGDKRQTFNPNSNMDDVAAFLAEGYAVASINYRLLVKNETEGIKKCIQDCREAITHIRNLPNNYQTIPVALQNIPSAENLNSDKIALWGSSAGAGIAMLIGFDADPITNPVKAIWADKPQATYDIDQWHSLSGVFTSCTQLKICSLLNSDYPKYVKAIYGLGNNVPNNCPSIITASINYRNDVDILNYINVSNDPPIWIENTKPVNNEENTCPSTKELLNHHKNHCTVLKDKLDGIPVEWHLKLRNMANNNIEITQSMGADNWNSGVAFVINKLNML